MYQLCVFDLDGTLVDTISDLTDSLNFALARYGYPTFSEFEVKKLVGHSTAYMCREATPEAEREKMWRMIHREFTAHYETNCTNKSRPYDGIMRMLTELRNAGVRLAVVSNKPHKHAMHVLETLFPRDSFSMILGMMEKFERKPDPEALQFVLDYFSVEAKDAVYVGDSEVDIQFANNTGIDCISCSWGLRQRSVLVENHAACIVDDPQEIIEKVLA